MKHLILCLLGFSSLAFAQLPLQSVPTVTRTDDVCDIDWESTSGLTYFVQYSFNLNDWNYLPVIESGNGSPIGYSLQSASDKMFVRLHYTNIPTNSPHSADFDNDGLTNWEEVRVGGTGTDPFDADSNDDGIRDDGLVYAAQNDPDGQGLVASLSANLTGRWDFEQLNVNSYANSANASYPAVVGGSVPVDNEGIISKASHYNANGDWLKIDPRIFNQGVNNSVSLWFSFEENWVQNKSTAIPSARRTTFWSYNTENTAAPKLVLSAFKATSANDQQKIILSTYESGILNDLIVAYVPQGKFIDDAKWHQLTFVQNSALASIWLDGVKLVELSIGNRFVNATSAGWFTIGKAFPVPAGSIDDTNFRGKIDRLRTYGKALNAAEIDSLYKQDADGDLLYDWFENEYRKDRVIYFDDPNSDDDEDNLTNLEEQGIDTHPRNFDTDGDLLPDGFEHMYQLDPKSDVSPNGKLDDPDGDGLVNIDEVIHQSDPKKQDTDGDGTNDDVEATQGSYANDASDNGQAPDPAEIMPMKVSVGDPSDSNSERYSLRIRDMENYNIILEHQARDFGVVSEKIYKQFRKGRSYEIQIRWLDTNKPENELPDFDYFSEVAFVNAADSTGYIRVDNMDFQTKTKVTPANGQKVLESSRNAQGEPVGTGSGGASDFLDTISKYRALILNTDVIVQNDIEESPPEDGTVITKTEKIRYQLSQHISDIPVILKDCITWQRRQLKWDGTYEGWTVVQGAKGHAYTEKPTAAGIFEVKAVIDGQDYLFKRKQDDPHSDKKEGENDCYGVADEAWQFDLWETSKGTLGSKIYAEAVKKGNFPKNSAKCNLFVYDQANAAGATLPYVNGSTVLGVVVLRYPPTANQWTGTPQKAIPNWLLLPRETYPQPGFIVSRNRSDGRSGHCGVLGYDGAWISAGSTEVNRKADLRSPSYNDDDPATVQGPARFNKYTP